MPNKIKVQIPMDGYKMLKLHKLKNSTRKPLEFLLRRGLANLTLSSSSK